jgi:TfoX/Sxy family transcriptional regulator of competence genes
MFGGIAFLRNGKMVVGVNKDDLMVRCNPENTADLVKQKYVRPMDFTGKPMRGFLYIDPAGYKTDSKLSEWIENSIEYVKALTS